MTGRPGKGEPIRIDTVENTGPGATAGVNYGTVAGTILAGNVTGLADAVLDPSLIPLELGLSTGDDVPVGGFIGRGWLIDKSDERILEVADRSVGGYVLIEAEAGIGKSALAAYLAFSPTRSWPAHFSRQSTNPETARANLAAQLIYTHVPDDARSPTDGLPGNYTDPAWFASQLITIQKRRRQRGKSTPLVILIDGLDEAPVSSPDEIAFGLPRILPPGVVIVATSRPGHPLPPRTKIERIDVSGQANLNDLREFLTTRARTDPTLVTLLAEQGITAERFSRNLLTRSGGVWIYALSVVDQIIDGGLPVDQLHALPPGLADYYSHNLYRIRESNSDRWESVGLPVLATLAAVTEPLTTTIIADWAGDLPLGHVQDFLDGPLRPFVAHTRDGSAVADLTGFYRLRHQSLRDFLTGHSTSHDDDTVVQQSARSARATRTAHARILQRITPDNDNTGAPAWRNTGPYSTAHLTQHAAAAGQLDRLALDPGYLLWASLPQLIRQRRTVTDPESRRAIAARELTGDLTVLTPDEQLRWLHIWAIKVQAREFAAICANRLGDTHPLATGGIWRGVAHTTLRGHTDSVNALCTRTRPDGSTLLASAGDEQQIWLWDPDTTQPNGDLYGHPEGAESLCVWASPQGTTLIASGSADGVIRLWDMDSLRPAGELQAHAEWVRALCPWTRADGTILLASAGEDRVVRLWHPENLQPAGELHGHTDWVQTVCTWTQPDGTTLLASAGTDLKVRLWHPETLQSVGELHGHTGWVRALCTWTQSDGTTLLASAGDDYVIRLWHPDTLQPVGELHGHTDSVRALCTWTQPDGTTLLASAGDDRAIRLWHPHALQPVRELPGHTNSVRALCTWTQPDGTTLLTSAGWDGLIRVWHPETLERHGEQNGHTLAIHALRAWNLTGSSTVIASAGEDTAIRLWDLGSLKSRGELHGHTRSILALCTWDTQSGTTLLASGGFDEVIRLWHPDSHRLTKEIHGHAASVRALCTWTQPNGTSLLASAGDAEIRLWRPDTLESAGALRSSIHYIRTLCTWTRPDGTTLLASAGDEKIVHLWYPGTLEPAGELHRHSQSVLTICPWPQPDGTSLLASAGDDSTIYLWRNGHSEPVGELHGHTNSVHALETWIQPDGMALLVSAGFDRIIRVWHPNTLRPAGELTGHTGGVQAICSGTQFEGSPILVTAGWDACIIKWANAHGLQTAQRRTPQRHLAQPFAAPASRPNRHHRS